MENYYLVFIIDRLTSKGKELVSLLDCKNEDAFRSHLRGFVTKGTMKEFVDNYADGLAEYKMLKPIS